MVREASPPDWERGVIQVATPALAARQVSRATLNRNDIRTNVNPHRVAHLVAPHCQRHCLTVKTIAIQVQTE